LLNEISYGDAVVYSREPSDQNIHAVLDKAEALLAASEINTPEVRPKIFFTNGFKLYSFLSLYIGATHSARAILFFPRAMFS